MAIDVKKSPARKRSVDPGYAILLLYLSVVTVLVLFSWLTSAEAAIAPEELTLDEVRQGQLLIPTSEQGRYTPAPLLSMEVDIRISGITARTTLKQRFQNTGDQWLEALYVFPLPEESAVDHLQLQVGQRTIIGEIKEKEEARRTYEAAKAAGKKGSLLSQHRPNVFSTAVANIGPHETVTIAIEYQQIVQRFENIFSLRFPMVVGPRYRPGTCSFPGPTTDFSPAAVPSSAPPGTTGTDLPMITRADVVAKGEPPINPVKLHLELAAGIPLARIDSLYHGITTRANNDGSVAIDFNGQVMADRDFVLEWEPMPRQTPAVALFHEQKGEDDFMLLMVMPPDRQSGQQEPPARETIFILDTSGSMGGASIRQAKKALQLAVGRMRPRDRFNIIEFNSETHTLFSKSRPGTADNLQQAAEFINGLEAHGGTEIMPALQRALDGKKNHQRIRQVIFLTDAWVSNEEPLFSLIQKQRGDSRLFMVGIGSAPNSYFMNRAAAMGRGSSIFIGKPDEVGEKMGRLFSMLEHPAITDLVLSGNSIVEQLPSPLPDLYSGEPLLVLFKDRAAKDHLKLSGFSPDRIPWQAEVDTADFRDRPGISVLWARKKIKLLMDSLTAGADPDKIRREVTALALQNHLVSRYTSLVAVEQQVSRPDGSPLRNSRQKTNLPAGSQHDLIFGGNAATATPAALLLCIGLLCCTAALLLAAHNRSSNTP